MGGRIIAEKSSLKGLKVAFKGSVLKGNGLGEMLKKAKSSSLSKRGLLLFRGGFSLFKGSFKGSLKGSSKGVKAFGGLINIFSSQNKY